MEVTKNQFMTYEKVRLSGVTNMFDIRTVQKISGLERDTIITIMKHYSGLADKYLKEGK